MVTFNAIKTVLLLGGLAGLLMAVGGLIAGPQGITIALMIALIMNGIAYFFSDKIVLKLYRAQPLDEHRYGSIYTLVRDLAQKMRLPMPKLWLLETPMANAFATGRNPRHASIAVTTGILKILDEDELRGVLAHELAHVKNRDILVSSVAATLASALGYIANMARYHAFYGSMNSRQRSERHTGFISLFIIGLLMPLIATLLQLAISRSREFLADESGAFCTHEPLALASALRKIHASISNAHLDPKDAQQAATAPLFIVHPFHESGILALLSTHPPVQKRIERLQKMAQRSFID